VIYAEGDVHLSAPHVTLGLPFRPPLALGEVNAPFGNLPNPNFAPKYGPGSLTVTSTLIDLGTLSLQNIGRLSLNAPGGDIRGDGTVDSAGQITLTAGQIYPATEVLFTIAASDYSADGKTQPGTVMIHGSGTRELPM